MEYIDLKNKIWISDAKIGKNLHTREWTMTPEKLFGDANLTNLRLLTLKW